MARGIPGLPPGALCRGCDVPTDVGAVGGGGPAGVEHDELEAAMPKCVARTASTEHLPGGGQDPTHSVVSANVRSRIGPVTSTVSPDVSTLP